MARMGRPTKLTDELLEKAWAYVDKTAVIGVHELLPTIEGLALELNISRETLYAWEEETTGFSDILENLRQAQAQKLMQNGLYNRYNPTISKMLLSKHGYVEKSEVNNKHSGAVSFVNDVPRPNKDDADS